MLAGMNHPKLSYLPPQGFAKVKIEDFPINLYGIFEMATPFAQKKSIAPNQAHLSFWASS